MCHWVERRPAKNQKKGEVYDFTQPAGIQAKRMPATDVFENVRMNCLPWYNTQVQKAGCARQHRVNVLQICFPHEP